MLHREPTITNDEDGHARSIATRTSGRPLPPLNDHPAPFRSPIEGENCRIDDHRPPGRARSYGASNILLGHAQWVNAQGRFLYGPGGARRNEAPDLAQRATA